MFSSLLIIVPLALSVTASTLVVRDSPISIPLARRFNITGSKNIATADRTRASFLKDSTGASPASGTGSLPVTKTAVNYIAQVGVGSPATTYDLVVDTGSSNTWVGAIGANPYVLTSTSKDTGEAVFVAYDSGAFFGEEFLDTVTLGSESISNQSIGAALAATGFKGVDGILGIGPVGLTVGTTSGYGSVPTVTDNLFYQGIISSQQVGISFEPTTSPSETNGQLTFGGVDSNKFTGTLHTVPITSTSPASTFVGIDQSITYGSPTGTTILNQTAGIVDTGTTLILLASDAFAIYQNITGGVLDNTTGLLKITTAQFNNLQSLFFNIGDNSFEITPNAQMWPRALNSAMRGDPDSVYLIVSDLGTNSGEGLDFINGFAFLERFYVFFDSGANQVGFAETPFTFATIN